MEYVDLADARIPKLGLGTWQTGGDACRRAVRTALEAGYRHVDTAQVYGNERAVGAGIAAADVDREEVFLTTKLWRSNLRPGDVRASTRASLDRLGVDAVDLLLIHWPHPRFSLPETLGAMEELRADGLVEHIGVSNFTRGQLRRARAVADAPVVTDQVLYNPYVDRTALLEYCAAEGLALTAYSPLARGAVLDDEVLAEIGDRYEKSPAQVALRYLVGQEPVVAIPKSTSPEHIRANAAVFDFELDDAEVERIRDLRPSLRQRVYNRLPALVRRLPV